MAKLTAWFKKHLSSKSSPQKQSADHPSFLPLPRRPLTPTSFDAPGSNGVTIQKQPPACLFFAKVPGDIRRTILIEAFGGKTLHMDLVVDSPRILPCSDPGRSAESHRKVWQWGGGVCYRQGSSPIPTGSKMRYFWAGPWLDACMRYIHEHKGPGLSGYEIGIMGFLLSCRQAYTEGIDIMCSTNCITIQSEPLLLHLPQLIPTDRLASIASLEMIITAKCIQEDDGKYSYNLDHLKPILDNIAQYCSRLRSLCISFMVYSRGHEILHCPALPFVDEFYRSMQPQLRDLRVELPYHAYSAVHCEPIENHPLETPALKTPFSGSLWRSLDGEEPQVYHRSIENYPYPPLKLLRSETDDERALSSGYWFSSGDEGPPPRTICF